MTHLETASNPENLKRVVIEPITRVEGHGKVTLLTDEENVVQQARLHIVEFRGFERFIQGRPYWDAPVVVQRLCGICPVSHHLAAGKAIDHIVGGSELTPAARKLRELAHYGQLLQSHALHFFMLCSPDLLFGFESDVAQRNFFAVVDKYPDIAIKGIRLRKYGQEVIAAVLGKRVHGTGAIPGGMNKALEAAERDTLITDFEHILEWSKDAVDLARDSFMANMPHNDRFGTMRSNYVSLVRDDGALELYDGAFRAKDPDGNIIFDGVSDQEYHQHIREEVRNWSYMKFPYLKSLGSEDGWYRVGPLARMNNCDFIDTPLAEAERQRYAEYGKDSPVEASLAYHWARMIELLHCAEKIQLLLDDPDILSSDLLVKGNRASEGIGVIEATRGTLIHHYEVDDNDLIRKANLIVATTHNNQAMNEAIRQVAQEKLNGEEIDEPLLNNIEVAVRAYDPCLSCATHAVGKMPLKVELVNHKGELVHSLQRDSDGTFT